MSGWLIIAVGLVYAVISVENLWAGNFSMSIIFAGYSFSNVGLYLLSK